MVLSGSYMFEFNVNKAMKKNMIKGDSSISSSTYYQKTEN
jgi:hypothetical protein